MTAKSLHPSSNTIDEALWAAYRHDDKAAVMDYLFRRNLVGIDYSRSFDQLMIKGSSKKSRAATRAHGRRTLINGNVRQIPFEATLN
jgi:hypothetical protein